MARPAKHWLRTALVRLTTPRRPRKAGDAGWLTGRFPSTPRAGLLRRQREFFLYVPAQLTARERVPLMVMLHGCSQDAHTFAEGTRMNELADSQRFIVLYPQQSRGANPLGCWNWFHRDVEQGGGEARTIATLVRSVTRRYPVDRSRVYLAGMSAGGAMTAVMAFRHGALFAACAIVAGVMYRGADSAVGAAQTMRSGARRSPEAVAEEAVDGASPDLGFVPALVIHGENDSVVNPRNAKQIVQQFLRFAELVSAPAGPLDPTVERLITDRGRTYRQRDYRRNDEVVLRAVLIDGLGHAWSGGDERHQFNDGRPPDATALIWDFVSQFRRPAPDRWPVTRFWAKQVGRWRRVRKAPLRL
ncbi:MAG TPA: PHB depolymerase family esterase [Steroidobacteraceae bacterium]|nr:PHB depolymerase family esterase [Steroidobacteraceae bacterium]